MKKGFYALVCVAVAVLCFLGGGLLVSVSGSEQDPVYDSAMLTENYSTQVEVLKDGSYRVEERIQVNMLERRHGIYRYIPQYGPSVYMDEAGQQQKVPYFGTIKLLEANAPAEVFQENGCTVFQLGSEDKTVYGSVEYVIRYQFTPWFQNREYSNAYYNVFPGRWQNPIPAGSSFSIVFPKDFTHENLKLYRGSYGEAEDGAEIMDLHWSGNTLEGTLNQSLQLGEGMTFFAAMPEGYFTGMHSVKGVGIAILALTFAGLAAMVLLFLAFGRDETIYPSVQFQPPQGLDSAAVGYILDGIVEDRDMLSLILYWADQGYLTIEEAKKGNLYFHRMRPLPADAPAYARTMFQRLFRDGDVCKLKDVSGKFYKTLNVAKEQVKLCFQGPTALYTKSSRCARAAAGLLCVIPLGSFFLFVGMTSYMEMQWVMNLVCLALVLAGVWTNCYVVDTWHSKAASKRWLIALSAATMVVIGLAGYGGGYLQRVRQGEVFDFTVLYAVVCAASVAMILLTVFMRKRTHVCVEWMGKLLGLREFIETAELDRLRALAEESPQLFYHILPYAYVMGLSDVFARKLKGLALEPPQWYTGPVRGNYFDYYVFHRSLMRSMDTASQALAVPEPPKTSGGSGFGGGGFSGGGGGGFSGGGFGGGGGGSW